MNVLNTLVSVLCGPDGKCCIAGSPADREAVDKALAELAEWEAQGAVAVLSVMRVDGADKYDFGFSSFGPPPYGIYNLYTHALPAQPAEPKPSSLLTDKELADPEYMRAYIDELYATVRPAEPVNAKLVDFSPEGMNPLEGFEYIWDNYATTHGRIPDAYMRQTVAETKDRLLTWFSFHREAIRAALSCAQAAQPVVAVPELTDEKGRPLTFWGGLSKSTPNMIWKPLPSKITESMVDILEGYRDGSWSADQTWEKLLDDIKGQL